jgi:uncharacterized protein (UPF0333 family)
MNCHQESFASTHQKKISQQIRDRGQATSEYALVMLAAALIALLAVAWATNGGGAGKIGELFDRVVDSVTARAL